MYCGLCIKKYQQKNPPRLIPTCGHTFCESCLTIKINNCAQGEIYVRCPIDGKQVCLQDREINYFPKNIGIMKEMHLNTIKTQPSQILNQLNINEKCEENEANKFAKSNSTISSSNFFAPTGSQVIGVSAFEQSIIKQNHNMNMNIFTPDEFELHQNEICEEHKKKLQIICIQDYAVICSSCAIFGDHKGHEFKSIQEVNRDKDKKYHDIINICEKRTSLAQNINPKDTKQQINKNLKLKKQNLVSLIKEKHAKLYDALRVSQKRSIQKLNKSIATIEEKIKNQAKSLEYPINLYKNWEQRALTKMESLESDISIQDKIKILDYGCHQRNTHQLDIVQEGNLILNMIQNATKHHRTTLSELMESIKVEFNEDLEKKMNDYTSVVLKQINENLKKSKSSINEQKQLYLLKENSTIDEYLLDEPEEPKIHFRKSTTILCQQKNPKNPSIKVNNFQSRIETPTHVKRNSLLVSAFQSPKNRDLGSLMAAKQLIKKKYKVKIPQKFDKNIDAILTDTSDLLDLTNGELGDQSIANILDALKHKKIRNIKLVRNKLNDEVINQLWPLIGNVTTLNLSQNNLSDRVLDSLLSNYKKVPSLKNIILSQNKIKQRNIKNKLEEIKKLDIIVSL